jgi:predicted RNase H-like nuclease
MKCRPRVPGAVATTEKDEPSRVYAVGVDLAWGEAPSGLALLSGPVPDTPEAEAGSKWRLLETARLLPLEGIATWIGTRVPVDAPLWVAVDAPLVAMNPPGTTREADKRLAAAFRPFRISAFPVDRETARRGAHLVELLEEHDITPAVPRTGGTPRRGVFETFPTASQLHLLDLEVPIRYKRGTIATRQENLERLLLRMGMMDDPALPLEQTSALKELFQAQPRAKRGDGLKGLEDRLDAVLCGLVAALAWSAPKRLVTYGDPIQGAITVPHPPAV